MKVILLALFTLTISAEVFAQRGRGSVDRGGSVTNGRGQVRDIPGRDDGRPGRGGDRPSDHRPTSSYERPRSERYDYPVRRYDPTPNYGRPYNNGGVIVGGGVYVGGGIVVGGGVTIYGPRYSHRPGRVVRTIRRSPMIWNVPFGYACGAYGDLVLNGRPVHNFYFSSDCYTALEDIRIYGDFCDGADLYDQSGILEAQFNANYECRDALGYYY